MSNKREVEQYFISSNTLASGTANVEIAIDYQFSISSAGIYNAPVNGEATLILKVTSASSTSSVTIAAKNLYGTLEEESYWTVATVTATTSGVTSVTMLHIDKSDKYDPNATGIKIKISRSESIDVTYEGRLVRG